MAHGLANAALISHVIRFNATDRPPKQVGAVQRAGRGGAWWHSGNDGQHAKKCKLAGGGHTPPCDVFCKQGRWFTASLPSPPPPQAAFPQYEYPRGKERYAELADMLGLGGAKPRDKVAALITAVEALKAQCGVPVRGR